MKFKPHSYQKHTINFIIEHPRAAIFLDMGLGKTVSTLTALDQLINDYFQVTRVLVIAPMRVARHTWPTEINKWEHTRRLTYAVAVGDKQTRLKALQTERDITIINRENVEWLIKQSGVPWKWDTVVIDESSSFKNPQSKRFKALRSQLSKIKRLIALTGTPSPNTAADLWAQFRLIDNGERLGRFIGAYRAKYLEPDKRNSERVFTYKLRPDAEQALYDQIQDITLSMKTADYLRLPHLTRTIETVDLDEKERATYDKLRQTMYLDLDGEEITAFNAAALAGKLTQLATGNLYHTPDPTKTPPKTRKYTRIHSRKLDALEDITEAANSPVLVAYWHDHEKQTLLTRFKDAQELKTDQQINDWNNGKIPIGLIHPASAGHGLNLQAGGHILVWYSLTWSLELYQQTNARLYRQGQTHPVLITHIITKDTIDERIMKTLTGKERNQNALLDAVRAELTRH